MLTCQKTFPDIPWAHRLHRHDGPCAFVHGHNWTLTFTFGCDRPDENGFVIDFGKLGFITDWIEAHLDHAFVVSTDDPLKDALLSAAPRAWKPYVVPNCSSEGMARHLHETIAPLVKADSNGRVFLISVEVTEDALSKARYTP